MKKIIFIFLILFIFIPNSNALSKFLLDQKIPNMYIETIEDGNIHNGIPYVLKSDDGNIVYCLNHQQKINTTDYYNEYNYNDKVFNLTDEQIDKINLISYYGYGYENHIDIKWYGVTQFLIWQTLNYDDIYFTDELGNKINAYEQEIEEIENLVEKHYTLPSFAGNDYEFSINNKQEILDYNSVVQNYEVASTNLDVYIHNNFQKVYVTTEQEGNYEINFIRKSPVEEDYILYYLNGSQSLISPGKIKDIKFKIDIKVTKGSITINRKDSENKNRKFATLEGAMYEIYLDQKLLTTVETDKNGIIFVDDLSWGRNYTIKELTPSNGYKLDTNSYKITLTKLNKNVVVNTSSEVIKGNLIINKYYGHKDNYQLENSAIFEIYDINNNLIGAYETENGIIEEKLEYGEYYAIQTHGISGYEYVDKFNISIKQEKDYIYDLYNKKNEQEILVVDVPNTKKYDYNKFIPIIFIFIGLIFIVKSQKKTTQ